jgi:hypothetical protein
VQWLTINAAVFTFAALWQTLATANTGRVRATHRARRRGRRQSDARPLGFGTDRADGHHVATSLGNDTTERQRPFPDVIRDIRAFAAAMPK